MGKRVLFTLSMGLILVGAASNNGWGEDRHSHIGAETWLRMKSAFPKDEMSAEILREESRGEAFRYGKMHFSDPRGTYRPKPQYPRIQETVPTQGVSRFTQ